MKIPAFFAIAFAMSVSAFAQTSPPAAPSLTAGAEFKGLRLDWDTVPGASWYQLEYRAHQTGSFMQQGGNFPATTTATRFSLPLHLFDWTYARYRVAACNSAGCTRSAEVSVSDLRRDAVGYVKPSAPTEYGYFGQEVDLSADGYNFVAGAYGEGDTTSDDFADGGAAYVFQRGANGTWGQRARLALNNHAYYLDDTSVHVASSGSGNTIAVGMPGRQSEPAAGMGTVYVFYAKPGTGNYARREIPRPDVRFFGTGVALSESGYVLAITANDPETRMAIYRSVNGQWQLARDFATEAGTECSQFQMSYDGRVIAELCAQAYTTPRRSFIRVHSGSNWSTQTNLDLEVSPSNALEWDHSGFTIDSTGGTIAVQFTKTDPASFGRLGTAHVNVYKRGPAGYSQVVSLTPGAWRTDEFKQRYGDHLALSGDGLTLAVGDPTDNGTGWGPRAAPLVAGTAKTGAVYVYRLTTSWKLANMVKPNYKPDVWVTDFFGTELGLSQTGKTLVVGMLADSSSATGIGGSWANSNRTSSGAVFMY
jgi:hypothetical protein